MSAGEAFQGRSTFKLYKGYSRSVNIVGWERVQRSGPIGILTLILRHELLLDKSQNSL